MTTLVIVPAFDVGKDRVLGLSARAKMLTIDQFGFERTPNTLHGGVIVAATDTTQAGVHMMFGEER